MRPAQLFGNALEFWLNAQRAYDLWQAKLDYQREIEKIKPLRAA
jgi:plasmid maintenance system antidote protein VapI